MACFLLITGDIAEYGRNVVVFGVPGASYCWPGLNYRWPNKAWPSEIEADFKSTVQELSMYNPYYLYWYKAECTPNVYAIVRNIGGVPGAIVAKCSEEKFEFLEDIAAGLNFRILDNLEPMTHIPFNVLSVDFVEENLVSKIIDLNESENAGAGAMTMRSASVEELSEIPDVNIPKQFRNLNASPRRIEVRESTM